MSWVSAFVALVFSVEPKLQSIGWRRVQRLVPLLWNRLYSICRGRRTHSILGCGQLSFHVAQDSNYGRRKFQSIVLFRGPLLESTMQHIGIAVSLHFEHISILEVNESKSQQLKLLVVFANLSDGTGNPFQIMMSSWSVSEISSYKTQKSRRNRACQTSGFLQVPDLSTLV